MKALAIALVVCAACAPEDNRTEAEKWRGCENTALGLVAAFPEGGPALDDAIQGQSMYFDSAIYTAIGRLIEQGRLKIVNGQYVVTVSKPEGG